MTVLELQEQRLSFQNELTELINQSETRELQEGENSKLAECRAKIDEIDSQIAALEEENRKLAEENKQIENKKEERHMKEVRLIDLINGVAEGRSLSEEEQRYVNGNKITLRTAINVSNAGQGQENVPEIKKRLDVAIRNASVLDKMGATWFDNAVGDVSIPRYLGTEIKWKGETDTADNGEGTFEECILKPKRLTAIVDISKTFLAQDANSAEALIISDIARGVAEKFDKTIFGNGTGDTNTPAGLFADTGYTTTGTAIASAAYADVCGLEEAVEEKNGYGDDLLFIVHPKAKFTFKQIQRGKGLPTVYDGKELDGYKTLCSNSVVNKGMLFMSPTDLAVATWNGVEITVDNISRAAQNEVRLVVNYYCDAKLRGNKRIAAEIYS